MMEAKTKKGLIVTGVVVGVVAVLYLLFNKKGKSTLTELQDIVWQNLVKNIPDIAPYKSNYLESSSFNDIGFMTAWYNGIKSNLPTFNYNNAEYLKIGRAHV